MALKSSKMGYGLLRNYYQEFELTFGTNPMWVDRPGIHYVNILGGDVARFVYYLAAADGRLDGREVAYINELTGAQDNFQEALYMTNHAGVTKPEDRARFATTPLESFLLCLWMDRTYEKLGKPQNMFKFMIQLFMEIGYDMISVDGVVTPKEKQDLEKVIDTLATTALAAISDEKYAITPEGLVKAEEPAEPAAEKPEAPMPEMNEMPAAEEPEVPMPVAEEVAPEVEVPMPEMPEMMAAEEATPEVEVPMPEMPEMMAAEEAAPEVEAPMPEMPIAEEAAPEVEIPMPEMEAPMPEMPIAEEAASEVEAPMPEIPVAEEAAPEVEIPMPEMEAPMPEMPVAEEAAPEVEVPMPEMEAPMTEMPAAEEAAPEVEVPMPEMMAAEEAAPKKKATRKTTRKSRAKLPKIEDTGAMSVEEIVSEVSPAPKQGVDLSKSLEISIGENGSSYIAMNASGPLFEVLNAIVEDISDGVQSAQWNAPVMLLGNCINMAVGNMIARKNLLTGECTSKESDAMVVEAINRSIAAVAEINTEKLNGNPKLFQHLSAILNAEEESNVASVNEALAERGSRLCIVPDESGVLCVKDTSGMNHSLEEVLWVLSL